MSNQQNLRNLELRALTSEFPQSLGVYDEVRAGPEGRRLPLRPRVPGRELHDRRHRAQAGRAGHRPADHRPGGARRTALRRLDRAVHRPDLLVLRHRQRARRSSSRRSPSARCSVSCWRWSATPLTRGQRDFSSVSRIVATRYEVLVEHKHAARPRAARAAARAHRLAAELLGRPGDVKGRLPREPAFASVELRGLEPLTPSMPWRCATSCATAPPPDDLRATPES